MKNLSKNLKETKHKMLNAKRQMQNAKGKKQKGITLIALVITVVMLLILAGTAITLSINGGDLFGKTESAKNKWNNATLKEEIQLVMLLNGTSNLTLEDKLKQISGVEVENVNGLSDVCCVTRGDSQVTVYADGDILDGKVSIWDGTSTEPTEKTSTEIHIYSCSELQWLQEQVNAGTNFAGYTVYLENNLDLGARAREGTTQEAKWENDTNREVAWTPIGIDNSKRFMAKFEGKNHIIKGVYVVRK